MSFQRLSEREGEGVDILLCCIIIGEGVLDKLGDLAHDEYP